MNKEIREMRQRLTDMAEKESMKLYRLARNLLKHGGSIETASQIREEANQLHMCAYLERLVSADAKYRFKYAFKC